MSCLLNRVDSLQPSFEAVSVLFEAAELRNRYSESSICFLFSVFTRWEAAAVLRATVNRSN